MKNLTFGGLGGQGEPDFKNSKKAITQNGGSNPHLKFQHSSSIIKCLKIGGTESAFGGLKPPLRSVGGLNFKISKKPHTEQWSQPHQKFQHSSSIRTAQYYFLNFKKPLS